MVYSFGGGHFPGEEGGVPRYDREIFEPPAFDQRRIDFANFSETLRPDIGPIGEAYESGFRVSSNYLPTKVRFDDTRVPLDIDAFAALTFVSPVVRDLIERFEPGVHQFEPVEYVHSSGEHVTQMFVLFICRRLDTVDRHHTNMLLSPRYWSAAKSVARRNPELVPPSTDLSVPSKIVFNQGQIGTAHLWHDVHINASYFASDALVSALVEENITGFAGSQKEAVA